MIQQLMTVSAAQTFQGNNFAQNQVSIREIKIQSGNSPY